MVYKLYELTEEEIQKIEQEWFKLLFITIFLHLSRYKINIPIEMNKGSGAHSVHSWYWFPVTAEKISSDEQIYGTFLFLLIIVLINIKM